MKSEPTPREKWRLFPAGEDVGPMVSPLRDDWSLDVPDSWPYDEPEPLSPDSRWHALGQQTAMTKLCGWDPTFLCAVDMTPRREAIRPKSVSVRTDLFFVGGAEFLLDGAAI